ncbi:MAG: hypothetical protein ACK4MT_05755 [Thermaurantiacus tibetensis]|uniref:hypothetical protein n=1 Tax=Thermaurantiacus tibetensis TaxID=2759035 RepID=UPI0018909A13|nr:hypothetical protein [Thermaurantiacus tibetensis]
MTGKPWTEAEEARLTAMLEAGASYPELAAALGRSVSSVRERRKLLPGAPPARHPRGFTPEEDARLLEMRRAHLPGWLIAAELGRSRGVVARRLMQLIRAGRAGGAR